MKKIMSLFVCLFVCLFEVKAQNLPPENSALIPGTNWKNCIVKNRLNDKNFLVGGFHTWSNIPPFTTRKLSVVSGDLTNNFTLTNTNFPNNNYDEIFALHPFDNGNRLIGGEFNIYNGTPVRGLVKILQNGTIDPTFILNNNNPGTYGASIRTIAVQKDDKIIIGGNFVYYRGIAKSRITRLNSDGTTDTSFNIGTGFNSIVNCIKLQSDGKIIVAGNFTSFNGVPRSKIARLNSNGTLDLTFNINYPVDKQIRSLLITSSGKIIIGGDFEIAGSITSIGGNFPCVSQYKWQKLARLNINGNLDLDFMHYDIVCNLEEKLGFNKTSLFDGSNDAKVYTLSQYSNGKIFVGGYFDSFYGIQTLNNICLLDQEGNLDESTFAPSPNLLGPDGFVYDSLVEPDGTVVIVGSFWRYNGIIKNGIERVSPIDLVNRSLNGNNDITNNKISLLNEDFNLDNLNDFNLSPNPFNDVLNISISSNAKIEIFDIVGKSIQNQTIENGLSQIDLGSLASGVYMMKVVNENNQTKTIRVVKK
jgi:uncharacterized delta-60 repeat protein